MSTQLKRYGDESLSQGFSILFGIGKLNTLFAPINNPDSNLIDRAKEGNVVAIVGTISRNDISGYTRSGKEIQINSHHVYSVIRADDSNNVELFDPAATSEDKQIVRVTKEEFDKFNLCYELHPNEIE